MVLMSRVSVGGASRTVFADIRFVFSQDVFHATSKAFPGMHVHGTSLGEVSSAVLDAIYIKQPGLYATWVEPNALPTGQYKPDPEAETVYKVTA